MHRAGFGWDVIVVAHKVAFGKPPLVGMHHTRVQSESNMNTNQWAAAHASIGAWELLGSNAIKQLGVQERASSPCHQLGTVPCGRVTDRITRVSVWPDTSLDPTNGQAVFGSCLEKTFKKNEWMHGVLNEVYL